jgi:two-component system LytT family response regulator
MDNSKDMDTSADRQLPQKYLNRVLIKNSDKNIFIDVDEINWIESSGNYVRLHLDEDTHLVRGTLKGLEAKLDPLKFIRIHRSSIVNIHIVKAIKPWFSGDAKVILKNGNTLKMSRNYKKALDRFKLN